jgi:hypothetical protein
MSIEAMKQALVLLKSAHVSTDLVWKRHDCVQALEEALAKQKQGEPLIWSTTQGGAYECGEYLVVQRVDGKGWNALKEHKQLLLGASLEDCKSICERDAVKEEEYMTPDEMINMARLAGICIGTEDKNFKEGEIGYIFWGGHGVLEDFAKLVAEKEREECAKIVEENANRCGVDTVAWMLLASNAQAIRARGDKA